MEKQSSLYLHLFLIATTVVKQLSGVLLGKRTHPGMNLCLALVIFARRSRQQGEWKGQK